MQIQIELHGLAKMIAETGQVTLDVDDGATYKTIIERLADLYPDMVGPLIAPDNLTLLNCTVFIRNQNEMITQEQIEDRPNPGDRLSLLTVIVGG